MDPAAPQSASQAADTPASCGHSPLNTPVSLIEQRSIGPDYPFTLKYMALGPPARER